ncbi:G-protein coupled receptor frpr-1 [Biomphalaria glabrata]|nr:G-protein coupled receptor frpr-1 [Biomphalaria glabrata]
MTNQVQQTTLGFIAKEIFVTSAGLEIVENFLDVAAISFFAIMGIVTNTIIIIVFCTQGFQDSVNISLTAMAIWELFKCIVGLAMRVYGPLGWISPVYRKTWKNISTPTLNYVQVFANYVTYVMAAYVAFERCLCVALPFKVKSIFVPRLTLVMMILISIVVILSFGIIFFVYDIYWMVDPIYNQSIIVYTNNAFYRKYGSGVIEYFTYIGFLNPVFCFVVIFLCTVVIFYQLHKTSKFRSKSIYKEKEKEMSSREKQAVKMLLVVIIVYILALLPRFLLHAGKMVEPEFYYLRAYHNLFNVCAYIVMTVDFINASVHLFIYLKMSTNFRLTFFNLFPWCRRQ